MDARLACLSAALALCLLSARATLAAATATEAGQWRSHQLRFEFKGFQSAYSCDWLEEKMRVLLKSAGVREHPRVSSSCRVIGVPAPGAVLQMSFDTLVPVNVIADPATQKSEPAVWRQVLLLRHRPFMLEDSDCELVQQFRDQVLPLFTTRHVEDLMHCLPSGGGINLRFEVLAPATPQE